MYLIARLFVPHAMIVLIAIDAFAVLYGGLLKSLLIDVVPLVCLIQHIFQSLPYSLYTPNLSHLLFAVGLFLSL